MSGIVAAYRLDQELNFELVREMVSKVSHRGPHGEGVWGEGGVGLAAHILKATPEAASEKAITEFNGCYLVWDGRLDNREEIIASLTLPLSPSGRGQGEGNITDPDLVLAAYREWGTNCLKRMLGDFSFVLWDERKRVLFAGRDRIGVKPFYYTWDGSAFYMASEAKPLFEALGKMPKPDDEMLLTVLCYRNFRERDHHRTFFEGIRRLPPAHYLLIEDGKLAVQRYWSIDLTKVLQYKTEEEYLAKFREIFKEAVKCRMRSTSPSSFYLSGGLDSSAIVSVAGKIQQEKQANPASLQAINLYSDEPSNDERGCAKEVAARSGISLHELFSRTPDPLNGLDEFLWEVEAPLVSVSRNREPYEFLRDRDLRVVLAGDGGDHLLDEVGFLGDLLSRFKFISYFKTAAQYSVFLGESFKNPKYLLEEIWQLTREVLPEVLPRPLLRWVRNKLGNVPPAWVNPKTAGEFGMKERFLTPDENPPFSSYGQLYSYKLVTESYFSLKLEIEERAHGLYGMEIRYPMLDSRLVEFVLSIPWQMRVTGERKKLVRRAFHDLLPEKVRSRKDKGNSTRDADEGIVRLCRNTHPEPVRNDSGWMDRYLSLDKARRLVERYVHHNRRLRFEVWFLITVDHWLKQFTGGSLHEKREIKKEEVFAASPR